MTNIIMASATQRALYLLRQDGTVFVVGSQEDDVLDNGGVNERNKILGAGYGNLQYTVKEYNAYPMAGGDEQGTTYLTNILTLNSGYYHTLAVQGRVEGGESVSVTTYTCGDCGRVFQASEMVSVDNGDGTVTLSLPAHDKSVTTTITTYACPDCHMVYGEDEVNVTTITGDDGTETVTATLTCTNPDCGSNGTEVTAVIGTAENTETVACAGSSFTTNVNASTSPITT